MIWYWVFLVKQFGAILLYEYVMTSIDKHIVSTNVCYKTMFNSFENLTFQFARSLTYAEIKILYSTWALSKQFDLDTTVKMLNAKLYVYIDVMR